MRPLGKSTPVFFVILVSERPISEFPVSAHPRISSDSVSEFLVYLFIFFDVVSLHQSTVDWFSAFEILPKCCACPCPTELVL